MQRLEAADADRLAAHLPRLHRLRQPLDLDGTERAAVEHPSNQPPRAGRRSRPRRARPRPAAATPGLAFRRLHHALVCPLASSCSPTTTSPVAIPTRALQLDTGACLEASTAATAASPALTARSASSSCARRIAEINEYAIAQEPGDEPVESRHRISDARAVRFDQVAHILGVEASRKARRADEIAEHHRQLTTLGAAGGIRCRRPRDGGGCSAEVVDASSLFPQSPQNRADADWPSRMPGRAWTTACRTRCRTSCPCD